jgi:3-oxoacyl-[acyl-carrier-protein] synthase-3
MKAYIEAISAAFPERVVTNEDLHAINPSWNMAQVAERAGVLSRHVASEGETAFDLSKTACDKLFAHDAHMLQEVDAIIYCTQSPDFIMPPNAHLLHQYLKLPDKVLAFDYNLACSGFVYGLAMTNAFIVAGQAKKVLLVTADTYSKYIHPQDRSARALFGDAAAATLISADADIQGFNRFDLASHGAAYDKFYIPAGGLRLPKSTTTCVEKMDKHGNVITDEHIKMDGMAVWSFINSAVPVQIREHLAQVGWEANAVDFYLFHQASKMTLDSLARVLQIDVARMPMNIAHVGNTVSASIALCLRDVLLAGKKNVKNGIKIGDKLLVSGFGVGLSYGTTSLIYERECHVY